MSFDHREVGTLESGWEESGRLAGLAPLDLDALLGAGQVHLVVLAAHPDDETLGAGGLLRRAATSGARVSVVVATDGESSHPHSPTTTVGALSRARRLELVSALQELAPSAAVHLLGLPDGALREHRSELATTVGALVAAAGRDGGRAVLCAPWAGDGHRDHRIVGEVARETAQAHGATVLEYPVWFWHWGSPDDEAHPWASMRRVDLAPDELEAKQRAMAEHRTQVAPLSDHPGDEALLGAEMLRHFERPSEVFVVSVPDVGGDVEGTVGRPSLEVHPSAVSLGEEFFDDFYDGRSDPWGFESRWYEERKRSVTIACLPRRRFRSALEIGCSTGVLTEALTERCDDVLGVDIAAAPLEVASRRLGDRARLEQLTTPAEWPSGDFDLVVLSEVGYYYGQDDLATMLDRAVGSLAVDGVLLLCHWRHPVSEYPLDGDEVHEVAASRPDLVRLVRHEEEDFLLDVLVRPPAVSVARETGLL